MAQTNADGSIILSTKLDTSGVGNGLTTIRNKFAALKDQKTTISTLTQAIKDQQYVLDKLNIEYAEFVAKGKQNSKQAQELKGRINDLTAEMKEIQAAVTTLGAKSTTTFSQMKSGLMTLASYFIGIQTIFAAIRFSGTAAEFATQTEASVQRLVDIYGSASDSVGYFIDQNARALGMSKAAAASFSSVYGNLFSVWADQATNAELTNKYINMTAVVASKTGRTVEDVQERVRSGLLGNTEAIEDLGIFVNVKTIEMTDAFQRMANGKSWEQLDAYTQQQIRSMAILEQATAKYGDEVADTSATIRNRYKAAYEDFQNSWGNIVNTVLLPVLETLTRIFDIATKGLNVLSGRSGQILENVELQEENTDKTSENINEQTKNQKDLNKEMKKTLAGFDDIQIISANTADNTGGGGGDLGDLGLGGTAPDGSSYEQEISSTLTAIMGVIGMSLAALGCILLFAGHIGWGLGFLIAGAATLGVTVATLGDDTIAQETKDALSNALIITGVVAILIGILLCMASQWGIGIGLMVIGVSSIVAPIALNWDGIKEQLQGSFGGWLVLGGIIAIVLGILLCFTPFLPLGIGLIVLGVGAVVAPIVANWDAILNAITGAFNAIIDWVKNYGLLVLGIILCLTGTGIPFGIALLVKWAKDGAENGVPIASAIVDKVKEIWKAIQDFWDRNIAPVFTAKFWFDLGKGALNGLIWAFELALNVITAGLRTLVNSAIKLINTIGGAIGLDWDIPTIPKISLPRLAQGTVVPPNKEFMAILGDNTKEHEIVSPISTMKQAFMEAMLEMGGSFGGGNTEVVLEIDGREFGRAVVEQGDRENRRIGTRLVIA